MDSPLAIFIFQVLCGVALLVSPVIAYSFIDRALTQRAVDQVGRAWCEASGVTFIRVEIWKNHFALIYREGKGKNRRKFRVSFRLLTWQIRNVDWLPVKA